MTRNEQIEAAVTAAARYMEREVAKCPEDSLRHIADDAIAFALALPVEPSAEELNVTFASKPRIEYDPHGIGAGIEAAELSGYRRGVEDAAKVVESKRVNLGGPGWPKPLIDPMTPTECEDAVSKSYAAGIRALLERSDG